MTHDQLSDLSITDQDEFRTVLAAVVETAITSGVDVRGPWEFETDGSTHNWEVEIIELAKDFDPDEE